MIDPRSVPILRLARRLARCRAAAAALGVMALLPACTRRANSEAPVLQPEPVVEVSGMQAAKPSLAGGTLDRSHWMTRSVSPYRGEVAHSPSSMDESLLESMDSSDFPSQASVIDTDSRPAIDAVQWLTAPARAAWQIVRLPVAAIFGESDQSSPQPWYDRAPEPGATTAGLGVQPVAASGLVEPE